MNYDSALCEIVLRKLWSPPSIIGADSDKMSYPMKINKLADLLVLSELK